MWTADGELRSAIDVAELDPKPKSLEVAIPGANRDDLFGVFPAAKLDVLLSVTSNLKGDCVTIVIAALHYCQFFMSFVCHLLSRAA